MKKKDKISPSGLITITFLFSLVGINAVWLITSWHGGALIALAFYSVITFLCLRKQHFQAGVIAGIIGFGIHVYELFVLGTSELIGIDHFFFYTNLILPIPLTITSYLASLYTNSLNDFYSKLIETPSIQNIKGLDSSLYAYRLNRKIRFLFSVDDDPLFDQLIITLYRVIRHGDDFNKIFNSTTESLYQEFLSDRGEDLDDENQGSILLLSTGRLVTY